MLATHKVGSKTQVPNYQSVGLISTLYEGLEEKTKREHMCKHLKANLLICRAQDRFLKGMSCPSYLLKLWIKSRPTRKRKKS